MSFFFIFDENVPEGAPRVFPVESLEDCKSALINLKKLKERYQQLGAEKEEEDEESESLGEAIKEQERQIQEVSNKFNFNNSHLRENISILLKENGLQVNQLETLLNLSPGYISRTLSKDSKKRLSVDVVWVIASLFEINMDDLINKNMLEPTKDMKILVDFIRQLKADVDSELSHWEKIDTSKPTPENWLFFDEDMKYKPLATSGMSKVFAIFRLKTPVGWFFIVKGRNAFGDGDSYAIFQFDEELHSKLSGSGYESENPLTLITDTFFDTTDILKQNCDDLYNAIKLHENDYVISNEAKSVIGSFMDYTFKRDIADDLPFK